jgi:HK97 gp10 family phage protein
VSAVNGARELELYLRQLPDSVRAEIGVAVEDTAAAVVVGARSRAPVGGPYYGKKAETRKPGSLRYAIRYVLHSDKISATVRVPGIFYARFIEYGTRKMLARPFLFPAAEQERPKLRTRVADALRKAVR